ncbi:hypothetical protein HFP15_34915 [Amycolatopsis sp. K13G38]|uniref:Uncharacterized protein n=1 Tax=Amycolatopsis acididurans TaxID=2724524 RepID=A0ABX1JE64_9PSEU|nr:hypothetical protein [Amycolatopsis acididurans]NKQ58065.1 hypothetical protein [Amycolatopsis acididurans]
MTADVRSLLSAAGLTVQEDEIAEIAAWLTSARAMAAPLHSGAELPPPLLPTPTREDSR